MWYFIAAWIVGGVACWAGLMTAASFFFLLFYFSRHKQVS